MIELLQRRFVSTWVLAKDLDGIADAAEDERVAEAARVLSASYTYPVDSIVLSPGRKVRGQFAANEALFGRGRQSYEEFLESSLPR